MHSTDERQNFVRYALERIDRLFLMFLESCPTLHMQTRRQAIIQLKWNHLGHRSNW